MAGQAPDELDVAIGARIRMRRKQLRLSQERLGEALGISFQQIQKYERGSNRVAAATLVRMGEVLELPASVLLGEGEAAVEQRPWSGGLQPDELALLSALRQVGSKRVRASLMQLLQQLAGDADQETG